MRNRYAVDWASRNCANSYRAVGKRATAPKELDELNLLTRLLLLGESLRREELESILSSRVVEALTNLGLASLDPADGNRMLCPVVLYPVGSVFTVSDRWIAPDGKDFEAPADFVYPAITPNTTEFLAILPVTPCDRFLELCSGTGTAGAGGLTLCPPRLGSGHYGAVDAGR